MPSLISSLLMLVYLSTLDYISVHKSVHLPANTFNLWGKNLASQCTYIHRRPRCGKQASVNAIFPCMKMWQRCHEGFLMKAESDHSDALLIYNWDPGFDETIVTETTSCI